MKLFQSKELLEAYKHVAEGGQALHVWGGEAVENWKKIEKRMPKVFRDAKEWGHLMDLDKERLIATAKRLGVNVIVVAQEGRRSQHIDLCGKPLERAKEECKEGDLFDGGKGE